MTGLFGIVLFKSRKPRDHVKYCEAVKQLTDRMVRLCFTLVVCSEVRADNAVRGRDIVE